MPTFTSLSRHFLGKLHLSSWYSHEFFPLSSLTHRTIAISLGPLSQTRPKRMPGTYENFRQQASRPFRVFFEPFDPTGKILHRLHSLQVQSRQKCLCSSCNSPQNNQRDDFTVESAILNSVTALPRCFRENRSSLLVSFSRTVSTTPVKLKMMLFWGPTGPLAHGHSELSRFPWKP